MLRLALESFLARTRRILAWSMAGMEEGDGAWGPDVQRHAHLSELYLECCELDGAEPLANRTMVLVSEKAERRDSTH